MKLRCKSVVVKQSVRVPVFVAGEQVSEFDFVYAENVDKYHIPTFINDPLKPNTASPKSRAIMRA